MIFNCLVKKPHNKPYFQTHKGTKFFDTGKKKEKNFLIVWSVESGVWSY